MANEMTKPCGEHTPCPPGYVDWHGWAEWKSKTHTQKRCPDCGLWAIWVRKEGLIGDE